MLVLVMISIRNVWATRYTSVEKVRKLSSIVTGGCWRVISAVGIMYCSKTDDEQLGPVGQNQVTL